MPERRIAPRSRTYYGGVIAFNRKNSTLDCLVRNFSPVGAMISLAHAAPVPDSFDLTIARKRRSFRARLVWRRLDQVGLAFTGEA